MTPAIEGVEVTGDKPKNRIDSATRFVDVAAEEGDRGDFTTAFEIIASALDNLLFSFIGFGDQYGLQLLDVARTAGFVDGGLSL